MSTTQSSPDQEYAFRSRKPHRKSRYGCSNCKQKRIKCDEEKPSCSNCIRRFDRCSFLGTAVNGLPTPEADSPHQSDISVAVGHNSPTSPASPRLTSCQQDGVTFNDMELFHNFLMKAGPSMVSDDNAAELYYWQTQLPQLAFQNEHIMYMMLAISALHMFQSQPHRPQLVSRAEHLYGLVLPFVIQQLPNLSADNCEVLYLCSGLICLYHFGRGPQEGQYLAFSDDGKAEWFILLRGLRTIMNQYIHVLQKGVLAGNTHLPNAHFQGTSKPIRPRIIKSKDSIEQLTTWVKTLATEEASFEKYLTPLNQLNERFDEYIELRRGRPEFPIVFGWLYRLSEEFVAALQAKKPVALVIFAHYCILLRESEEQRWVLKGWSAHTMTGVLKHLHPDYHKRIETPREAMA